MELPRGARALVVTFDATRLRDWLGAKELIIEGAPSAGGWSNETVFVRADDRALVLRLAPSGASMFPHYDLAVQSRCLQFVTASGLPVPGVIGAETDPQVLGRAFFVMERLAGRVPADDNPPFTKAGFLFDATLAQQQRFCGHAIDLIAAVHALQAPDFLALGPTPRAHLAWCEGLYIWAELEHPAVAAAHAALLQSLPADDAAPTNLLWGDARPANMVVDDEFSIVGLLDWELAGSGPGEMDIAWFCEMNHMRSIGMGITPLPGFLSVDAIWQRWELHVGRAPTHVAWHHRFAAYRVAVLMFLFLNAMIKRGKLPREHRLTKDNTSTRRLQELFN